MFKVGKIISIHKKCDRTKYIDSNVYSSFYILYLSKYNYTRTRVQVRDMARGHLFNTCIMHTMLFFYQVLSWTSFSNSAVNTLQVIHKLVFNSTFYHYCYQNEGEYNNLVFFIGRPFVSLTQESPAFFNECVQLKAAIRSFPKHESVKWMKGKKYIDITQPKYEGSTDIGDSPILCINHIDRGDAARYKIKVHNDVGTSTCKIKKLEVNGGNIKVKMYISIFKGGYLQSGFIETYFIDISFV